MNKVALPVLRLRLCWTSFTSWMRQLSMLICHLRQGSTILQCLPPLSIGSLRKASLRHTTCQEPKKQVYLQSHSFGNPAKPASCISWHLSIQEKKNPHTNTFPKKKKKEKEVYTPIYSHMTQVFAFHRKTPTTIQLSSTDGHRWVGMNI